MTRAIREPPPPSPVPAWCAAAWEKEAAASPSWARDALPSWAERAKTHPRLTADMQSLCWGSLYFFSLFSYVGVGHVYDRVGSEGLFALFALTSLAMLVPAAAAAVWPCHAALPYGHAIWWHMAIPYGHKATAAAALVRD